MSRFINDDAIIAQHTREAEKLTIDQLAKTMYNRARLLNEYPAIFEHFSIQDLIDENETIVHDVVDSLIRLYSQIDSDNQYNVRSYHCKTEINDFGADIGESLGGFHTIGDFTFFGFFAGDAWDYATFMIIYHDGKHLRLYTPIRGNFVNVDCGTALGREPDIGSADAYVQKYGYDRLDVETVGFNFDAIQEDILATIKVV